MQPDGLKFGQPLRKLPENMHEKLALMLKQTIQENIKLTRLNRISLKMNCFRAIG